METVSGKLASNGAEQKSKIHNLYQYIKQHPGVSSSEAAKDLSFSLPQVWNMLSYLQEGKYLRAERANGNAATNKHPYNRYFPTSRYVPASGRFSLPIKRKKRRATKKRAHKVVGTSAAAAKVVVKANQPASVLSNRVGIALTMDGKQVVVPVRAAKEVYVQLKEIFA